MKCNRYAIYGWKSNRAREKLNKPVILGSSETTNQRFIPAKFFSHYSPCEGEIESQVSLEFIPYYGGSDANIEVRFRCKKCGYEYAGDNGLPYDVDSLNKYLTEIIKERN